MGYFLNFSQFIPPKMALLKHLLLCYFIRQISHRRDLRLFVGEIWGILSERFGAFRRRDLGHFVGEIWGISSERFAMQIIKTHLLRQNGISVNIT